MKAMFAVQLRTTLGKFHKTSHEIHLEYVYVSNCLQSFQSGSPATRIHIYRLFRVRKFPEIPHKIQFRNEYSFKRDLKDFKCMTVS